jgi:hypothetical protein
MMSNFLDSSFFSRSAPTAPPNVDANAGGDEKKSGQVSTLHAIFTDALQNKPERSSSLRNKFSLV